MPPLVDAVQFISVMSLVTFSRRRLPWRSATGFVSCRVAMCSSIRWLTLTTCWVSSFLLFHRRTVRPRGPPLFLLWATWARMPRVSGFHQWIVRSFFCTPWLFLHSYTLCSSVIQRTASWTWSSSLCRCMFLPGVVVIFLVWSLSSSLCLLLHGTRWPRLSIYICSFMALRTPEFILHRNTWKLQLSIFLVFVSLTTRRLLLLLLLLHISTLDDVNSLLFHSLLTFFVPATGFILIHLPFLFVFFLPLWRRRRRWTGWSRTWLISDHTATLYQSQIHWKSTVNIQLLYAWSVYTGFSLCTCCSHFGHPKNQSFGSNSCRRQPLETKFGTSAQIKGQRSQNFGCEQPTRGQMGAQKSPMQPAFFLLLAKPDDISSTSDNRFSPNLAMTSWIHVLLKCTGRVFKKKIPFSSHLPPSPQKNSKPKGVNSYFTLTTLHPPDAPHCTEICSCSRATVVPNSGQLFHMMLCSIKFLNFCIFAYFLHTKCIQRSWRWPAYSPRVILQNTSVTPRCSK